MKKTYEVHVTETVCRVITVEAADESEALAKARDEYSLSEEYLNVSLEDFSGDPQYEVYQELRSTGSV